MSAARCLELQLETVEDGMSEEFGMIFEILVITPDNVLTKACNSNSNSEVCAPT